MPCLRENLLSSRVGIDEIRLGRHALLVLLACLAAHAGGEVPTWEAKRRASQAAWFEQDDAEEALTLLEDAFVLRPPPDAEPEMLKELVQLLEGVNDEQRVLSALEKVHAALFARHGYTSHTAISLAATLATAKASMNDAHGALQHASQVVEAIVTSLQELEQAETARLDVEAVGVLENTLTRMTALYAQHGQLDLAVDTSRKAMRVADKLHGAKHVKVAQLQSATATLLLEMRGKSARLEALELLEFAREVLQRHHHDQGNRYDEAHQGNGHDEPNDADRRHEPIRHPELASQIEGALRTTLENLVVCHREANNPEEALRHLLERRTLPGTREQNAEVERNIAAIFARKGELVQATFHYEAALGMLNISDAQRRASVLESLANIAFLQTNYSRALTLHQEALGQTLASAKLEVHTQFGVDSVAGHWRSIASCHIRMGEMASGRDALISGVLQAVFRCDTHQCVTSHLLALLASLNDGSYGVKQKSSTDKFMTPAAPPTTLQRTPPVTVETGGQGGGRVTLEARDEATAKTLLTIAMLDSKAGLQAEALTHARRARDLLLFASHASGKERDIARELVGTLEARLENNAF